MTFDSQPTGEKITYNALCEGGGVVVDVQQCDGGYGGGEQTTRRSVHISNFNSNRNLGLDLKCEKAKSTRSLFVRETQVEFDLCHEKNKVTS